MADVTIYTEQDFEGMRKAGRLAADCLDHVTPFVKPGVSTEELDKICHDFIIEHNAIPSCLGYHGYPKTICSSVNHVVCHGIPSEKKILKKWGYRQPGCNCQFGWVSRGHKPYVFRWESWY